MIKVFDSLSDGNPKTFADLRTNVHNFWDRGLLGLALDPSFPDNPYVYALYTYDHELGSSSPAPEWGTAGATSDPCPNPPGATGDGCVVSGRLSKLQASGDQMTGSEQVLVEDWCQQYPSHSVGGLAFGRDGKLYASAGEVANFNSVDYGQGGGSSSSPTPKNPCGDPPTGVGGNQTPPTAEGGALRSQDRRTPNDPNSLDGALLRLDPDTGQGVSGNPFYGSQDPNARRIVAYGLRNPFRFATRPGTDEIWLGNVGWDTYEAIDRVISPTDSAADNFGWPCYEGPGRQAGYDAANLNICENLYNSPGAVTAPFYTYDHSEQVVAGESCPTSNGSSIAGLAFYDGGSYPDSYDGALFFTDYSRKCIWAMHKGTNGLPDLQTRETFLSGAQNPVDLQIGPGGDLFYVDLLGGTVHRISYDGTGGSTCPTGQYQAQYYNNMTLSGSPTFTRCEDSINNDWGLGSPVNGVGPDNFSARWTDNQAFEAGDYTFSATADDGIRVWVDGEPIIDEWKDQAATTYTATRTMTAGEHEIKVEYYDDTEAAVAKVSWQKDTGGGTNAPPTATIDSPSSNFKWKVGDTIDFSGSATDPEDGKLPDTALSWALVINHCMPDGGCHVHPMQTFDGVSSGSFSAPDHEYPSYLELQLTAKDSHGLQGTKSVRLNPQTVDLTFGSYPPGLQLVVGSTAATSPFSRTVIAGSTNSVSALSPQGLGRNTYTFASWSDGGAQSHDIVAGTGPSTYIATYRSSSASGPGRHKKHRGHRH